MTTRARFYLLFDDPQSAFDLMAECVLCGAIIEQALVIEWETRHVTCSNCGVVMRLDHRVLTRLREQAVAAQATIERLGVSKVGG